MTDYTVAAGTSLLVLSARSSVGTITWRSVALEGSISATVADGALDVSEPVQASVSVPVESLTSGNATYDAELRRRIDVRAHPTATIGLDRIAPGAEPGRYLLAGVLHFHGQERAVDGAVSVEAATLERLVVSGQQTLDIRDFGIATPTVLRLRIYPDVRLDLLLEARA